MEFTDDDLRNMKDDSRMLRKHKANHQHWAIDPDALDGIINRLEAAEKCVRHSPYCNEEGHGCDCGYEAWLKTKGNTIGGIPVKLDSTMPPGKWRIEKSPNPQPRYISEEDI